MTTEEVAAKLGISTRRIRALIKSGQLQAEKRGRDWWITPASLAQISNRPPGRPKKG